MKLKIYTDGACSGNPGKGGWAAIILDNNSNQSSISGSENNTTNNRMELLAPIMSLKKIKRKSEITIFTDSKYVKDGITDWIKKWKVNNWKNSNKKSVKNKDLWIKLDNIKVLSQGAALRFLLTRVFDALNKVEGAIVKIKDPMEYLKRLEFHKNAKNHEDYFF